MLSSGRFSAFAATASESNATRPYFIAGLKSEALRSATVTAVSNTVDRNLILYTIRTGTSGSTTIASGHLNTGGQLTYISDTSNVRRVTIRIPKEALPTSGTYYFSYSFNSDIAVEYSNITLRAWKEAKNAALGSQTLSIAQPDTVTNAGEFSCGPVLIDFRQISYLEFILDLRNPTNSFAGVFGVRYEVSANTTETTMGFGNNSEQSNEITAENTAMIAQSTQELVYSQNETNGKLDQIIQHISDQLAAMWDQIAGYLITPWMQQDRDLHDETIETLEDLNTETNTTITNETHWHANFIIEGLKSLFIPSDTYFQTTINDLMTWFNDRLGFLGYTLTYLIRLLNGILNAPQNPVIRFPGIHAPNRATNEDYVLLPAMDVNLAEQISMISEGSFNLLEFLRTAGDIVLVLAFIVLLQDKLHEVET